MSVNDEAAHCCSTSEAEDDDMAHRKRLEKKTGSQCEHEECRRSLFIRSVPHDMNDNQLADFFRKYVNVQKATISRNHRTGMSKGTARVKFESVEAASTVLELNANELYCGGKVLRPVPVHCVRKWRIENSSKKNGGAYGSEITDQTECAQDCFINRIPNELLNIIFSFLDVKERIRIEQVCKHWRYVNHKIPWHNMYKLSLCNAFKDIDCQPLNSCILDKILSRCGSTLRKIDFSGCNRYRHQLSKSFPVILANYCPNLEAVNFEGTVIKNKSLKIFSEECRYLKDVNVSKCFSVEDKSLKHLFKNCNLQHLTLGSSNITGASFVYLKDGIEYVDLSGCFNLKSQGVNALCERKTIRGLRLNNTRLEQNKLINIFSNFNSLLTDLEIEGYFENLTEQTLKDGLSNFVNLIHLSLAHNSSVTDDVINVVTMKCSKLRFLNINDTFISNASILFLEKLENLKNLHISYNRNINNEAIIQLSQVGLLETLEIRGNPILGDAAVLALIHGCNNLKLLDISNCFCITDATMQEAKGIVKEDATATLKIIAGGTAIKDFIKTLCISVENINLCPSHYRPREIDYSSDDFDAYSDDSLNSFDGPWDNSDDCYHDGCYDDDFNDYDGEDFDDLWAF